MRFELTEEQQGLRDLVRTFADRTWTDDAVRAQLVGTEGFRPDPWQALGSELDVLGLALPEAVGGAASGLVSLAVLAEELGRVLAGVPLLGSIALTASVLAGSGDPAALEVVPELVGGAAVGSLVATNAAGRWAPEAMDVIAKGAAAGIELNGSAALVLDAVAADHLVVVARTHGGPALHLVRAGAPGLTVSAQKTLDQTRRLAEVHFRDTPAQPIGEPEEAMGLVDHARDVGALVLAAEAVGATSRLLQMSVQYAGTRLQFGRAIGSFQGVKHRCADMYAAVEQSRSTAYHAAWTLDDPDLDDPRVAVNLATVETAGDYLFVVKNAVQVHGGIGFTWEHPLHLYYKRAVSDASLLGGRAAAAERLAVSILDQAS